MLSLSVAVQVILVTPFGYGASSASVGSSLLTPTSETTPTSSVAVARALKTATHDPRTGVTLNACLVAEADGGAVATVVSLGTTVTTGGRGGVNRTTSFA